jgi:crotonobetaine/carnitine-CoA ligase
MLVDLIGQPSGTTTEVLSARVEATPHAPFLIWHGQAATYLETWEKIGAVSGWLLDQFPGRPGLRVAAYLGNCPEAVWINFGCHRAGGVYVGLNRGHKGDLLNDMLIRSGSSVIFVDFDALEDLPRDLTAIGIECLVIVGSSASGSLSAPKVNTLINLDEVLKCDPADGPMGKPTDLATLMYTSGTTGRSKAARQPHGMLCRGAARIADAFGYQPNDVFHSFIPPFHIVNHLHVVMGTVIAGGAVALFPSFSLSQFWQQVKSAGCTIFCSLPTQIALLLKHEDKRLDAGHQLRFVMVGPQPSKEVRTAFEERFGVPLRDSYGMTEVEPLALPERDMPQEAGSCGRANPDFELAILSEEGWPLPSGKRGELVARPRIPGIMMQSYEGDAEKTLEAFRCLWFHTGDLAEIDVAGNVSIVGRLKHMIRRRGENISAWELEKIIAGHAAVDDCAAVGVPSPLGEEDVKVVVVPKADKEIDPGELRAWCAERMAKFMVPRFVEVRSELPLTELGKVAKEDLKNINGTIWDAEEAISNGPMGAVK